MTGPTRNPWAAGAPGTVPPEVQAVLLAAGVTISSDPTSGGTAFSVPGLTLCILQADPPGVAWPNPDLGRFMRDLFAYHNWLLRFEEAKGIEAELLVSERPNYPDRETTARAGVATWQTGNRWVGTTTHYSLPGLGEFVRRSARLEFSSPEAFMALGTFAALDEYFTPTKASGGLVSPFQEALYMARIKALSQQGCRVAKFEIGGAEDGPKHVFLELDLAVWNEDEDEVLEDTGGMDDQQVYRLVLGQFGADDDISRVTVSLERTLRAWDRLIADTTALTHETCRDDVSFAAFMVAKTRLFSGELRRLVKEWAALGIPSDLGAAIEDGAVPAAEAIIDEDASPAIAALAAVQRLDLTVEALALLPEWQTLFELATRHRACDRLSEHGMPDDALPGMLIF